MSRTALPLVFIVGERAVSHAVDPARSAGELHDLLRLYFSPGPSPGDRIAWLDSSTPRPLDPDLPIGEQVPPDAEIIALDPGVPIERTTR